MKKILMGALALSLASFVMADDFGWEEDASSDPALTVNGVVETNARAYVEASSYEIDANKECNYADRPSFGELNTKAFASGKLNLNYTGPNTDLNLKIKLDNTSLGGSYYWDILDEFTARAYLGHFQLEAGKMRLVWGKGDKLHVLDNFNANDYLDYIIPDYIDRRIAEPMMRLVFTTNSNVKIEGVYTPLMTPDRLASDGLWQPKSSKSLATTVTSLMATKIGADLSSHNGASFMKDASFSSSDLYPDTNQLKYGQWGSRMTFTLGGADLGFSYYYGHNKQPSADVHKVVDATAAAKMKAAANASALGTSLDTIFGLYSPDLPTLQYDKKQVFGFEAAGVVLGRINSRMEVAYTLTEDFAGDDPWVHNNSLGWIGGFDIDLPFHNINVNVQNQGSYTINYDKIEDNVFSPLKGTAGNAYASKFEYSYKEYDVDYNGGYATNNKLVMNISDTWNHEKVKLDLKGIYGIERGDLIILPTLTFKMKDDLDLNLSGMYIWCKDKDSEFDGWNRNSFAQIGVKYQF